MASLVYNMQPSPGFPVQFGFNVAGGLAFVLETKLRSDGDYGVTVGDSANPASAKLTAVDLTFCENGAGGTKMLTGLCEPPLRTGSRDSKPFLTNPTQ